MHQHGGANPGDGTVASSYTRTTTHKSLRIILLSGRNQTKKTHRERNVIYIKLQRDKLISSPGGRMGVGRQEGGIQDGRRDTCRCGQAPRPDSGHGSPREHTCQRCHAAGFSHVRLWYAVSLRRCCKGQRRGNHPSSTLQNPGFLCSAAFRDPHGSATSADDQDKTTTSPRLVPNTPFSIPRGFTEIQQHCIKITSFSRSGIGKLFL